LGTSQWFKGDKPLKDELTKGRRKGDILGKDNSLLAPGLAAKKREEALRSHQYEQIAGADAKRGTGKKKIGCPKHVPLH